MAFNSAIQGRRAPLRFALCPGSHTPRRRRFEPRPEHHKGSSSIENDPLFLPAPLVDVPLIVHVYGAASVAHKPTFFDLMLEQLVVPFVTVTVYVPGLFTVIVSVLPPETIPPDGPLHE